MYETPPLLTIKRPSRRPTAEQIAAYQGVPSAVASDAMEGGGAMASTIRHHWAGAGLSGPVAGPALTAWTGARDLLALHACKEFAQPGDIVVSAFDGHQGCAVMGDAVGGMMKNAGVAAVVTDGPVRDSVGLRTMGLPVWCTGVNPSTPFENGPGTVGLPVQIGNQQVETGDMIVADHDGVVVVPFARIDEVAVRAAHILALEKAGDEAIRNGLVMPDAYRDLLKSDRIRWIE